MGIQLTCSNKQTNMKLAICVVALAVAVMAEPEADAWGYYGRGYGLGYGYGGYRGYRYGKRSADAAEEKTEVASGPSADADAYFYGAYPHTYGAYGAYPYAYGAYAAPYGVYNSRLMPM